MQIEVITLHTHPPRRELVTHTEETNSDTFVTSVKLPQTFNLTIWIIHINILTSSKDFYFFLIFLTFYFSILTSYLTILNFCLNILTL